ncbi:hypothetical protein MASR2M15_25680 [Anaerolineales bacterium]
MSNTPPEPQPADIQQVNDVYLKPPNKSNRLGCAVVGMLTLLIVTGLIAIGLFLPPISLMERLIGNPYTQLSSDNNGTILDGFTLAVSPEDPGQGFGVLLSSIAANAFESAGSEVADWIPQARANIPYYLSVQSPVYSIETEGQTPSALTLSIAIPPKVADVDVLDMYGWYSAEQKWQFIPSRVTNQHKEAFVSQIPDQVALFRPAPLPPTVVVAYDVITPLSEEVAQLATIVSPAGLQPRLDGSLTGSLAPGFNLTSAYQVMPVIRDFSDPRALDTETTAAIMSNSQLRQDHARQIALVASASGYDGVFIDYRGLKTDDRDAFSDFIRHLDAQLNSLGLKLGVVVPEAIAAGTWDTGAYDWRALGTAADYLQINLSINPNSYVGGENEFIDSMTRWAIGEVSRNKILLGLSAQSIREIGGTFTSIGFNEAIAGLGDVVVDAERSETGSIVPGTEITASLDGLDAVSGFDTRISAPFIEYLNPDGSTASRIWLSTAAALRYRMDKTVPLALGGVAFEDLLTNDTADDVLNAIIDFKTQLPSPPNQSGQEMQLRWTIEGSDGYQELIYTNVGEDLVVTVSAPDGNYAFNVAVVGVDQPESLRGGEAVALFQPTATPTLVPTATPTLVPTATSTPVPIVATAAPAVAAGGGQGANVPGAGSISVGNFEYGGHVTSTSSGRAVGAMRTAGMNWMKEQVRYYPGDGPGVAADVINAAHNNGFKVLIGTVGNPNDLGARGEGYIKDYVAWLAGIAALGADAIEVWNEPNLSREWPEGQISGSAYTSMLAQAYGAIKAANGSTMVISAALAPTGAEAAFPGRVINDDNFLRDMVNAGALNYMDCVGVHYNEGIISPQQTSGDPRDSYYTRYFPSMISTYWNITGGQRPLCFTELGYLSPEGFGSLPDFFAWAQNVTVSQQAAWLAQAAALASQSGKVRMMIVWNIDFQQYGSDPQGGYAIIRPDGSCPACNAMAGAR